MSVGNFVRKLIHLPGTQLTPEVVLHRTLNKKDHIKSVTVIIQWDDDSFAVDWSEQTNSAFCMGATILQAEAINTVRGDHE